jgi:S-adenosylmethionine/arginine decarboxylase-like enzyme
VGYSSTCIIETSSITFHSWMESHYPVIQLDVYSCKDFEVETVLMWLRQFDPERIDYKFLDREHDFKAVKDDTITFDQKANYVE